MHGCGWDSGAARVRCAGECTVWCAGECVRSGVWDAFGRAGEVAALAARRSRAPSASSEQCVRAAAVPQSSPVRGTTRSQPRS